MKEIEKTKETYLVTIPDTSSETGTSFVVSVDPQWGSMKFEQQIPGMWRTKEETIFILRNLADTIEKHL